MKYSDEESKEKAVKLTRDINAFIENSSIELTLAGEAVLYQAILILEQIK